MIIVVTGGRYWKPSPSSDYELRIALDRSGCSTLRHGGCRGLDTWAGSVAFTDGYPVQVWAPTVRSAVEWKEAHEAAEGHGLEMPTVIFPPEGRKWPSAGPLRNRDMVQGADILFAYPGGPGTASCVREARKAGLKIVRMP